MLKLTILGSGTAIPHPSRAAPGYVLETAQGFVLLDPGPGSLQRMEKAGYSFSDLRLVLVTHFHCDHATDLIPLFFARNVPSSQVAPTLTLCGPEGLRDYYERMVGFLGKWVEQGDRLILRELLDNEETELPDLGCRLQTRLVEHSGNCLGFRIIGSGGQIFAYSGDSTLCENLTELVKDADIALVECSSPAGQPLKGHMTPREVAQLALRAMPARLLLTHRFPVCDGHDLVAQVREFGYQGRVAEARDGESYLIL